VVFVAEHWPHAPEGSQAGVAPPQSPSPPQARQAWVVASQMGLLPLHWALVTHDTQVPLPVLQYGVVPVQSVVLPLEHWPHAPDGSHAGVEPPQSLSPPQPRQAWRLPSQIGAVALLQSALARHDTHVPVVV
jgi:hypothetical protein